MAFGAMRIGKYLFSRRIFVGAAPYVESILELRQHVDDGGPIRSAMVYFSDTTRDTYLSGDKISVLLDTGEVDLWYRVIQTEDPIWFGWSTSDEDGKVRFVGLSTSEEPPGEGFEVSPR